jgi:hypothetical protein
MGNRKVLTKLASLAKATSKLTQRLHAVKSAADEVYLCSKLSAKCTLQLDIYTVDHPSIPRPATNCL